MGCTCSKEQRAADQQQNHRPVKTTANGGGGTPNTTKKVSPPQVVAGAAEPSHNVPGEGKVRPSSELNGADSSNQEEQDDDDDDDEGESAAAAAAAAATATAPTATAEGEPAVAAENEIEDAAATATVAAPPDPPGWIELDDGTPYYYCAADQTTQWTRPQLDDADDDEPAPVAVEPEPVVRDSLKEQRENITENDGRMLSIAGCSLPLKLCVEIVSFVGPGSYRFVAGTCKCLRAANVRAFPASRLTSFESTVSSDACALLFLKEGPVRGQRDARGYWLKCHDLPYWAAKFGRLDVLKWLKARGVDITPRRYYDSRGVGQSIPADEVAIGGHIDCMEYLTANGYRMGHDRQNQLWKAARHNHIHFLDHFYHEGYDLLLGNLCAAAAMGGHLDCIKFLRSIGCGWGDTCHQAAAGGHYDILKYAHENGCEWSARSSLLEYHISARAAESGSLACLKYIHENGGELIPKAAEVAAKGGHLECLKYLHEHGIELSSHFLLRFAQEGGHDDCFEYIKANNKPKRDLCKELHSAVESGEMGKVEILLNEGTDIDAPEHTNGEAPLIVAFDNCKWDVARLLIERGANVDAMTKYGKKTSLHFACIHKRLELICLLLDHHADIEARDREQRTPLHDACGAESPEAIEVLLDHHADIEARDREQRTPLHDACLAESPEAIELLLDRGANIEASDHTGFTPLFKAFRSIEAVKLLLDRGADPNAKTSAWTAISRACCQGDPHIVRLLLDRGAKLQANCLHRACQKGSSDLVKLLLDEGAEPNEKDEEGNTPAHCAANLTILKQILERDPSALESTNVKGQSLLHKAIDKEKLAFLLEQGLDVNFRDNDGYTPLHSLHHCGTYMGPIQLLLAHGAIVDAEASSDLKTPLHIACQRLDTPVAQLLIDNGANVDAQDSHGNTPLHTACTHYQKTYHITFVQLLLDRGANMEITNEKGQTPLHIGCFGKRKDNFVELMLQRGANADAQDLTGATALHLAASHPPVHYAHPVRILLENGANANIRDFKGRTPLHVACENEIYKWHNVLVDKGADLTAVDGKGRTALHISTQVGDINAVRDLLFKGAAGTTDVKDNQGNTALHCACFQGRWDIAMLILRRAGAPALSMINNDGQLPSHGIFDHDGAPLDFLFHAVKELRLYS